MQPLAQNTAKMSSSSASSAAAVVAMHWFRKGLRIHDNAALLAAVELAKQVTYFGREISSHFRCS